MDFRRRNEDDLDRELRAHLEAEAAEQQQRGLSPEQARFAARRALGNLTLMKEDLRSQSPWSLLDGLSQDFRLALRALRRSPAFTAFAVLTLALGLGANGAIFSVVEAVLLRPLPFRDAHRLIEIWEDAASMGFPLAPVAPANFADWKTRSRECEDFAALKGDLYALTGAGTPEQLEGSPITANLFPLLGIAPLLGRTFTAAEDRPGGPPVVLISYGLWQRRLGADPAAVGRDLWLNARKYTIVGVMPRGVTFPERSDVWLPLALGPRDLALRDEHSLRVFARLKPGRTRAHATRDLSQIAAQLAREYPNTNAGVGITVVDLRDQLVGNLKPLLWSVAAGVGCVLLIVCANLAAMLLVRAAARRREFAVRIALGVGRLRLLRQTLVESLILAAAGGALAILLALAALPVLSRLVPATLDAWTQPSLNLSLLAFLLLLSALSAVLFGTLPALLLSRANPADALRSGGRTSTSGSTGTRRLLIVAEVAIAVVVLVGAGLLARTLWALARVPLGYEPAGVMTARTALPVSANTPYRDYSVRSAFYTRVLERVQSIPGVVSAGYTTFLPLTNSGGSSTFLIEGAPPPPPGRSNDANHRVISAAYLQTLGVRLIAGRFLRESDGPGATPVALVNQAMARQYWPGRDPLGRRIQLGRAAGTWITIVGIVDDIHQAGLEIQPRPEMYFPYTQPVASQGYLTPHDLAVRVQGEPAAYAAAIQAAVWEIDRNQPVTALQPFVGLIATKLAARRLAVQCMTAFAALALLLAAFGLYGLLAYTVLQRRREIGVRIALGARPRQVASAVLREGLLLVAAGLLIGLAASTFAMRLLHSLLYAVAPTDPVTTASCILLLGAVGLAASYLPAHRAAATDPIAALRHE